MKIAVIGGGSTYTPELLGGFIREERALGLAELWLVDVDAQRLDVVGGFCRRMARAAGARFAIHLATDRSRALDGAAFVLTQIRVGGQAGRHRDIQLGLRHGLVGQETTGVGGCAKALRTIPVLLDLAEEMRARCPEAWLINFTNPSGLVTEALLRHGQARAIGLCNIPITLQLEIAARLGVDERRVQLDYVGLNHLGWVRRVLLDGQDVLPTMLEHLLGAGRPANLPEELDFHPEFLRALRMVPNSYLHYYYATRRAVEELRAAPRDRAQEVMEIERELLSHYADPAQDAPPPALARRGGAHYSTAALRLICAIHADRGERQVVNVASGGAVPGLEAASVAEVPCRVDGTGAHPLPLEPLPPEIRGLLQHVKAYEELTIEAAVRRSRRHAVLALAAHPLVADAALAVTLADEIAAEHSLDWLKREEP